MPQIYLSHGGLATAAAAAAGIGEDMAFRETLEAPSFQLGMPGGSETEDPDVADFCVQTARLLRAYDVTSEQVREVLGGISNLYLETALDQDVSEFSVETTDGLASGYVPIESLTGC